METVVEEPKRIRFDIQDAPKANDKIQTAKTGGSMKKDHDSQNESTSLTNSKSRPTSSGSNGSSASWVRRQSSLPALINQQNASVGFHSIKTPTNMNKFIPDKNRRSPPEKSEPLPRPPTR